MSGSTDSVGCQDKGARQARLEAHEKALETLFESYNKYWENVGLSEALCATMAAVIVSATEDDVSPDGPSYRAAACAGGSLRPSDELWAGVHHFNSRQASASA